VLSEVSVKKIMEQLGRFFVPGPGASRWTYILPYLVLALVFVVLFAGGTYGWEHTNSSEFCGTTCHTMPPQGMTHLNSPHENVTCEECHIGRASFVDQFSRKSQALHEIYYTVFSLYEYPIRAKALQPARDTCEKCHRPETFANDSLRQIKHFANDQGNTASNLYLVMKTGGGDKRDGLGFGIHWHITNKVLYYSNDELSQDIPYVRVYADDGSFTEYTDVEAGFDPSTVDESQLKQMDCSTCHNRVTHDFMNPADSVDDAMLRGVIDPAIPSIHHFAVSVLTTQYATRDDAAKVIAALEDAYKRDFPDYYSQNTEKVQSAIVEIQSIYDRTVFHDQKIDWTTHPNNLGHVNSPGCFRCHDGKHLNDKDEAARLECNLCHSIPVASDDKDLVTTIEINSGGIEPASHLNPNWISLHNSSMDQTCAQCHTVEDAGGTSDTSFCSNSACHGSVFTYAGFDAPTLREILKDQIPTPPPAEAASSSGAPAYDANIGALFQAKCGACHGESASGGLNLTTYADLMKGGAGGAVIVPNDSAASLLIKIQSGKHYLNLTEEELDFVSQWIDAGAPEK
jgi:nitrate/TMAO reductase-like tetraheme cytochrome c subunit/mono/diheme cytochrome c family protein